MGNLFMFKGCIDCIVNKSLNKILIHLKQNLMFELFVNNLVLIFD